MNRYSKKMRQKLRELSSLANDRELNQKLDELYIKFQRWKNGEIDGLQLHDLIHEYHNREGKEIWKIYNQTDADFIVTRAYRLGILADDEIPADVKDVLHLKKLKSNGYVQLKGITGHPYFLTLHYRSANWTAFKIERNRWTSLPGLSH